MRNQKTTAKIGGLNSATNGIPHLEMDEVNSNILVGGLEHEFYFSIY
jgi:hypothetical protein